MANQWLHTTSTSTPHSVASDDSRPLRPPPSTDLLTVSDAHDATLIHQMLTNNQQKMTFQLSHQLATLEIETISVSIASVVRKFHFKPQFYLFIFVPFFSIGSLWRQCNGFWLVFCVWFCYLFIFWIVVVVGIVVKRGFCVTVKTKHALKVIRTWRSSR